MRGRIVANDAKVAIETRGKTLAGFSMDSSGLFVCRDASWSGPWILVLHWATAVSWTSIHLPSSESLGFALSVFIRQQPKHEIEYSSAFFSFLFSRHLFGEGLVSTRYSWNLCLGEVHFRSMLPAGLDMYSSPLLFQQIIYLYQSFFAMRRTAVSAFLYYGKQVAPFPSIYTLGAPSWTGYMDWRWTRTNLGVPGADPDWNRFSHFSVLVRVT